MASTACFCGAVFATVEALHHHALSLGHLFTCGCGTVVATRVALVNHKHRADHTHLVNSDRYLDLEEPYRDPRRCGICRTKPRFKDQGARDHHNADKHKACPVCSQVFDSVVERLRHQKAADHCYCAEHGEAFSRPEDFAEHERADAHVSSFECAECQRSFRSDKALDHHLVSEGHKKIIDDATAKEAESNAAAIKLAQLEESNLRCEACKKSFKSLTALRQHKESLKHKPLSELKCPISNKCTGTFTSPSALLFHLESGGCKGSMTHNKLNAIVYQNDTDRHITSDTHVHQVLNKAASEASRSINPGSSASVRACSISVDSSCTGIANAATADSSQVDYDVDYDVGSVSDNSSVLDGGGIVLTPSASTASSHTAPSNKSETNQDIRSVSDDSSTVNGGGAVLAPSDTTTSSTHGIHTPTSSVSSSDGSIILTPPASLSSSAALSDWSFLTTANMPTPASTSVDGSSVSTITYDTALQRWPCPSCPQKFRQKHDLSQHMNSAVHAPKVFHCPIDLPGLPSSSRKKSTTYHFKTLSGLAQHIEAGSCKGGKATLGFIVGIFGKQIEAKMGKSVKFLKA